MKNLKKLVTYFRKMQSKFKITFLRINGIYKNYKTLNGQQTLVIIGIVLEQPRVKTTKKFVFLLILGLFKLALSVK